MSKKVLIIAGGGIFGYIATIFLKHAGVTNITKNVDALAGTSIGGIEALYLGQQKSAEQLYEDFKISGPKIFAPCFWRNFNPFLSKYSEENIETELKKMLPGKFGDIKIPTIIPTVNFKFNKPKIFDNIIIDTDCETDTWKIGRSTSAAPTYFPPFELDDKSILIDGGLIENIPIMTTKTALEDKLGWDESELEVFAIGTGYNDIAPKKYKDVCNYSEISWLRNLLIPYTTMGNEMSSIFWANHTKFKSFSFFNPICIEGGLDDASQITDGTLDEACKPWLDTFKKIWEGFLEG